MLLFFAQKNNDSSHILLVLTYDMMH